MRKRASGRKRLSCATAWGGMGNAPNHQARASAIKVNFGRMVSSPMKAFPKLGRIITEWLSYYGRVIDFLKSGVVEWELVIIRPGQPGAIPDEFTRPTISRAATQRARPDPHPHQGLWD